MLKELKPHALTSIARVKARLSITVTDFDTLFERLINAATDTIENFIGNCRLLETTYTQEVYSGGDGQQKFVTLRNYPVTALTAAQYRAGIPGIPAWTDFIVSQYELVTSERVPRRIRIYNYVYGGTNNLRFTYTAGYKIDFTNPADATKHTLPFDISDVCERMVVWAFKKRDAEGKSSEGAQEASVSWLSGMSQDDKDILADYNTPLFL